MYYFAVVNEVCVFPDGRKDYGHPAPVMGFHLTLSVSEPASHVLSPSLPFPPAAAWAVADATETISGGQQ